MNIKLYVDSWSLAVGYAAQAAAYGIACFIASNWLGAGPQGMFASAISLGLFWGALINLGKEMSK